MQHRFRVGNKHVNHICSGEVFGDSQPKTECLGHVTTHCSCIRRDDHQCIYPYCSYSSLFAFCEGEEWSRTLEVLKEVDSLYLLIPCRRKSSRNFFWNSHKVLVCFLEFCPWKHLNNSIFKTYKCFNKIVFFFFFLLSTYNRVQLS